MRRIAEDADLTPILVDGAGNPLYAGRTRRTASRKMRLALGLRDKHCAWHPCDRPPSWTAAHHKRLWVDGGPTNIDEMSLLCTKHHRKYHAGYRLRRYADGRVEEIPPESTGPNLGPAVHSPPLSR